MLCIITNCSSLSFRSSSSFRSISNRHLLSSAHFSSISDYKNLTSMLQYETKLRKYHRTTTIRTNLSLLHAGHRSLRSWAYGRGRVGGSCPKLREAGRTRRVDQALAIQYRPCFSPPPALMMASPESGAVAGSQVSLWSCLPTSVYAVRRAWMLGFV